MEDDSAGEAKMSSKGVSQRRSQLTWSQYLAVLEGANDLATNTSFRLIKGTIHTCRKKEQGLRVYYDKRCVLPDGTQVG